MLFRSIFETIKVQLFVWGDDVLIWFRSIPGKFVEVAEALGSQLRSKFDEIFTWVKSFIVDAFVFVRDRVAAIATEIWQWVVQRFNGLRDGAVGIFTAIRDFVLNIWTAFRDRVAAVASEIWQWVAQRFTSLKDSAVGIFTTVRDTVVNVWTSFRDRIVQGAQDIWTWVTDKFTSLKTGVTNTFQGIKDTVSTIWNGLKDVVKAPIKLTFDFVNDNMIGPVNSILDKFPGKLSIPTLPRLASGGLLRGPGTGTSDSILGVDPKSGVPTAAVSNGEFVVKAAQTRKHLGLLRAINSGVGQFADGGLVQRFGVQGHGLGDIVGGALDKVGDVAGGVIDKARNAVSAVKNFATDMLEKGARKAAELVLKPVRDAAMEMIPQKVPLSMLSGGIDKLYNAVLGKGDEQDKEQASLAGGTFGSSGKSTPNGVGGLGPAAAAARAFVQRTFGINNIGGYANRNIAGTGTKSDHALGKAIDVMIANYKSAGGIAQGNAVASYFVNNPGAFGTKYVIWRDQINSGRGWAPYGHPGGGRSDTLQHRDHVHVSLFDDGGVLPPGLTLANNKSGKPEGILTNEQLGWLRSASSGNQAAPLVGSLTLVVDERNGSVRDQMDEAMFQLRRIARGGANVRR